MSPRNVAGLLADILAAAEYMRERAGGLSRDQYLAQEDLQVIFERKFEIIGEALSRLRKTDPSTFECIRHAAAAVDFRNVLIHGYASIDHEVVWATFTEWLPELVADVSATQDRIGPS
jgi:uncharacterized protein with HEPN domain